MQHKQAYPFTKRLKIVGQKPGGWSQPLVLSKELNKKAEEVAIIVQRRPSSMCKQDSVKALANSTLRKRYSKPSVLPKEIFSPIKELEDYASLSPSKSSLVKHRLSLAKLSPLEKTPKLLQSAPNSPKDSSVKSPTQTCPSTPAISPRKKRYCAFAAFSEMKRCSVEPPSNQFEERLQSDPDMAKFFDRCSLQPTLFTELEGYSKSSASWHWKGCEFYYAGHFAEAIEKWEPAYLHNKTYLPVANNYALATYMLGSGFDFAAGPVLPSQALPKGQKYYEEKAHKQKEGYRMLVQLSLLYPKSAQLLYNKAVIECHLQKYAECLETVKSIMKLSKINGKGVNENDLYRIRAIALGGKGVVKRAINMYGGGSPLKISSMGAQSMPTTPISNSGKSDSPVKVERGPRTSVGIRKKIVSVTPSYFQRTGSSRGHFTRNLVSPAPMSQRANCATVIVKQYEENQEPAKVMHEAKAPSKFVPENSKEDEFPEPIKMVKVEPSNAMVSQVLSYTDGLEVIKELSKTFQPKNFNLLDEILGRKSLLSYLPRDARMPLYRHCVYQLFKGSTIISLDESVYILLKGSIRIQLYKKNPFGINILRSKTKYEGDHFFIGSALNMGEKYSKPACYKEYLTLEDVAVVSIPKAQLAASFNEKLYTPLTLSRAKFLGTIPLFHGLNIDALHPIAALAEEQVYGFGATLLREKTTPEGMFIILEGQCQVCLEDVATRINRFEGSPRNILFSPNIEDLGTSKKEECIQTDVVAYPQYYVFAVLGRKDYFGSRMLFSSRQWDRYNTKLKDVRGESRAAYLSVIADSALVKVLVVRKGMLDFVPGHVKRSIINRIKQFQDEDRPENVKRFEQKKANMQKWETFKEKIALEVLKSSVKKGYHP